MAALLRGIVFLAVCFTAGWPLAAQVKKPVDYADPLIDSAHSRWIFFSSACRPFAMVNLSPDTNAEAPWNSSYMDHKGSLCGLSHVHAWEIGAVSVMPISGQVDPTTGARGLSDAVSPRRRDLPGGLSRSDVGSVQDPRGVDVHAPGRLPPYPLPRKRRRSSGVQPGDRGRHGACTRCLAAASRRSGGGRLPGGRSHGAASQAVHRIFRGPVRPADPGPQRLGRQTAAGARARGFGQGLRRDRALRARRRRRAANEGGHLLRRHRASPSQPGRRIAALGFRPRAERVARRVEPVAQQDRSRRGQPAAAQEVLHRSMARAAWPAADQRHRRQVLRHDRPGAEGSSDSPGRTWPAALPALQLGCVLDDFLESQRGLGDGLSADLQRVSSASCWTCIATEA